MKQLQANHAGAYDGKAANAKEEGDRFRKEMGEAVKNAGYPTAADPAKMNNGMAK